MVGIFPTELHAAVAPLLSEPFAGETPLFTGEPAARPSGVAPILLPNEIFPVTGLWL